MKDLADWAAVVIAVVAAGFVHVQIKQARSQIAIQTARDFVLHSRQLWAECIRHADESESGFDIDKFRFRVAQIIGHFEINVICLSDLSLSDRVYLMIERTIVDHMEEMVSSGYLPYVKEILFRKHVCPCLKDFCLQRSSMFENKSAIMDALCIERSRWA